MNDLHGSSSDGAHDAAMIFELGSMRHIQRTWRQFGGVPFANNAEHSFRVAWIAWILAVKEGADVGRVVRLALAHDIGEIRSVDVNYLSRLYATRDEDRAIADTVQGTSVQEDVAELWLELQERKSLEAKIVKDADALDCDFELQEMAGIGLSMKDVLLETRVAAQGRLHTDSAREMWQELYDMDPHSWHLSGPNRLNSGDWRGGEAMEVL